MEVTAKCDSSFHYKTLPLFLFFHTLSSASLDPLQLCFSLACPSYYYSCNLCFCAFLIVMDFILSLHLLHFSVHLCLFYSYSLLFISSLCLFSYQLSPPPLTLKWGQCSRGFNRQYTLYIEQEREDQSTVQSGREHKSS